MRWRLDYKKHCRVQPGTYCEVHDEPVPTNTMAWRSHEGLLQMPLGEDKDDTSIPVIALDDDETHDEIQDVRRYPKQARRSVVGNQPYDT